MISLFLDTSSKYLIIALYKENKQLYFYKEESNNDLSRKVLPKIEELLNKLALNKNDIDKIYVVNGPGSFTGVRIGVTIAKVWAWALKKKIYKVSSLQLLATTPLNTKYVVPLIDARRGYVYAGIYENNKTILEDQYILLEELKEKINQYTNGDITYVSYDDIDNTTIVEPKIDILKILNQEEFFNPHEVNPNYLKKTEAEENLNK